MRRREETRGAVHSLHRREKANLKWIISAAHVGHGYDLDKWRVRRRENRTCDALADM
jgi:hypothetical protein